MRQYIPNVPNDMDMLMKPPAQNISSMCMWRPCSCVSTLYFCMSWYSLTIRMLWSCTE